MSPRLAVNDAPDVHLADAVFFGQQSVISGRFDADGGHCLGRNFESAVSFSDIAAPFRVHIMDVIGIGPKKQMRRIAAWGIVAVVADKETVWNGTVGPLISQAVRFLSAIIEAKLAVSERFVAAALPFPATIGTARLVNPRPELRDSLLAKSFGLKSFAHDAHGHRNLRVDWSAVNG